MTETAERLDEPSVFERQPGMIEHECRTTIRDMLERHGPMRTRWLLSHYLEDEIARMCRNGKEA